MSRSETESDISKYAILVLKYAKFVEVRKIRTKPDEASMVLTNECTLYKL